MNFKIDDVMCKYNLLQIAKIKDFLISEIDDENLQETIDFVNASDKIKKDVYTDYIYTGGKYQGLFIEGNQYLISSDKNNVYIIDYIGEENGIKINEARLCFTLSEFIFLIKNKHFVLKY